MWQEFLSRPNYSNLPLLHRERSQLRQADSRLGVTMEVKGITDQIDFADCCAPTCRICDTYSIV